MLSIDFRKAYDTISHKFIINTLKKFGYGNNFVKWIEILLKDFKLVLLNGGSGTEFFDCGRGARQGDPISSFLFILCIELLCIRLRNDNNVIGVEFSNLLSMLCSIFADDIVVFLRYSEENLRNTLGVFNKFSKISGLCIQVEKSQISYLGGKFNNSKKLCQDIPFVWSKDITLLGLDFNAELTNLQDNIKTKKDNFEKDIKKWEYRFLTPLGRNTAMKTYILPRFNHVSMVVPILDRKLLQNMETKIYNFIWKQKSKISRNIAKLRIEEGGLNMPDLGITFKSFIITWLRKIDQSKELNKGWIKVLDANLREINRNAVNGKQVNLNNIWSLNAEDFRNISKAMPNPFWKEIFGIIPELLKSSLLVKKEWFLNESVFGSSLLELTNREWANFLKGTLRSNENHKKDKLIETLGINNDITNRAIEIIENSTSKEFKELVDLIPNATKLNYKSCPNMYNHIHNIAEILKVENNKYVYLNHVEIYERLRGIFMPSEYESIKKTIGIFLLIYDIDLEKIGKHRMALPNTPIIIKIVRLKDKGCTEWSKIYRKINYEKFKVENIEKENKYERKLGLRMNREEWENIYKNLKTLRYSFIMRWFQYRLNRGILETNTINSWDPTANIKCTFCNRHNEDIRHLLWDCNTTKSFLAEIRIFLENIWPDFTWENNLKWFLFGKTNENHANKNRFVILNIIRFIYTQKTIRRNPTMENFKIWFSSELYEYKQAAKVKNTAVNLLFLLNNDFYNIDELIISR